MKLRILAHICRNFSFALSNLYVLTVHNMCFWYVCVEGGEGAYLILHVLCSRVCGFLHLDSTTSELLETLQPSRFKPPVILPSHYPMKTLEGPQTLSEHPLVKSKCACLRMWDMSTNVHVTHLLSP